MYSLKYLLDNPISLRLIFACKIKLNVTTCIIYKYVNNIYICI